MFTFLKKNWHESNVFLTKIYITSLNKTLLFLDFFKKGTSIILWSWQAAYPTGDPPRRLRTKCKKYGEFLVVKGFPKSWPPPPFFLKFDSFPHKQVLIDTEK